MTAALADRLKLETRALHTAAERSAFMALLLHGRMPRGAYGLLLRNLHALYAALEPALARQAAHPVLAPVVMPALWRREALAHDLSTLFGVAWMDELELVPATIDQVDRIRRLEAEAPERLLAHAYVRYLGDLSGGQILRRIVGASAGLGGATALAFYDFGGAADADGLARAFRAGIEQVPVGQAHEDAVVDEARSAFVWHLRLFGELAAASGLPAEQAA